MPPGAAQHRLRMPGEERIRPQLDHGLDARGEGADVRLRSPGDDDTAAREHEVAREEQPNQDPASARKARCPTA